MEDCLDYSAAAELAGVYLEDSYVLGITEELPRLTFKIEAVLTPDSPRYHTPDPDEQYCYAMGQLVFRDVSRVAWERKSFRRYTDAEGAEDMGNIDFLRRYGDHWYIGGDWGEARVFTTAQPEFVLMDEGAARPG